LDRHTAGQGSIRNNFQVSRWMVKPFTHENTEKEKYLGSRIMLGDAEIKEALW
jgi:hypothetical protein